jgi:molecular chaperone GrpE
MSDSKTTEQAQAGGGTGGDDLSSVSRERDELLDQLQRTRAEFLNYQKRSKSLADEERKYAIRPVASDLVDVMDNFDRAIDAARAANVASIVDGLEMVHRQLLATFAKHGVTVMSTVGQPFDPNQHEAIFQQPVADKPEGTVVAELGRGYRIHDRVLRPAKVAVSVQPADAG